MNNMNWFCDLMGLKLNLYQKIIMQILNGKRITRMKKIMDEWMK